MCTDLCKKESGRIWNRKLNSGDKGIVVKIKNSRPQCNVGERLRIIRFTHVDFNRKGNAFIAADCHGHVYFFDLAKNRFCFVQKIGSPCTALCFKLGRGTEFLIGCLADYSMRCFDIETKELMSTMRGHQGESSSGDGGPIRDIEAHSNGRLVVSAGERVAQLWDVMSFTRLRRLNINSDVAISKAFFLPTSDTLITCFKDDTIFAWNTDTMTHRFELTAGKPNRNETKIEQDETMAFKKNICSIKVSEIYPGIGVFDLITNSFDRTFGWLISRPTSRDGKLLCAGGKASCVHMWDLVDLCQQRVIQLSAKLSVKQLLFIEHCFTDAIKILGILTSDGIMKFVRIDTCKLLFEIGAIESPSSDQRLISVALSSSRRQIAAINELGEITLYDVDCITDELSRPPIPISTFMDEGVTQKLKKIKVKTTPASQVTLLSERIRLAPPPPLHLPPGMRMSKLLAILKQYGEYPAKYRLFIWRSLLRIPENHEAYASLVDKGTHPRYEKLHEVFPLKSKKMNRILQRILSALAYWSPIFGEAEFLPLFVFPFVKLSENNQLVCFEIVASLLMNWSKHWFEYFPSPPINILAVCENLLAFHDKKLLQHFCLHSVTSQVYAWPILESVFSEILTRDEWLRLLDHLITGHSSTPLFAVIAYCVISRNTLLKCSSMDDFKYFFRHRNPIDLKSMITEMYSMMSTTPDTLNPLLSENQVSDEDYEMAPGYTPLTSPSYPIFNKYPKFIVDYQIKERDRIKQEEQDYINERTNAIELEQQTLKRQNEENTWCRQQDLLLKEMRSYKTKRRNSTIAEGKRRDIMDNEQKKLIEQRKNLESLTRDLKLKQLQSMDETRRKFIEYQHKQKLAEIARMDDQIRYKSSERVLEKKKVLMDVDLKQMDLKLTNESLEKELHMKYNENRNSDDMNQNRIKMLKGLQKENDYLEDTVKDLKSQIHNLQIRKTHSEIEDESTEYENLPQDLPHAIFSDTNTCSTDYCSTPKDKFSASYIAVTSPREEVPSDYTTQVYNSSVEARKELLNNSDRNGECLNHSLTTNSSAQFSIDRSERSEFEKSENELMREVRKLRQKLATNQF